MKGGMSMSDGVSPVLVAGDFCARGLTEKLDRAYACRALSKLGGILPAAELRFINLENAVLEGGEAIAKSGPPLKALPENLVFLEEGGFDCAILANNHAGDYGEAGVLSTLRELEKRGIAAVGAGPTIEDSYKPAYFTLRAGRLAVLAFCENEFGIAGENKAGTAGFALGRVMRAIREAKENADFVLAVMHGGNEHNPLPSPRVVERYRMFVEFGAHAVIGMHPHCVQGYEIYNNAPILYSTGNFLFFDEAYTNPNAPWYTGYLVKLFFSKADVVRFELQPYRYDVECTEITPFTGREKRRMLSYLAELSKPIQDPDALRRYFYGWCMIGGPGYAKSLQYKDEYRVPGPFPAGHPLVRLRNTFTCEAHNELMTTYLRLLADGELHIAEAMREEVLRMQSMPV